MIYMYHSFFILSSVDGHLAIVNSAGRQTLEPPAMPLLLRYFFYGEGNGNPLQYSCLENPMEGGAW